MKLSVPPPPPPPPPSDGTPGAGSLEEPNEQSDATASAPAEQPAAPVASKSKLAVWPSWFSGVDAALVGLVILFTFAAASFAARNSDLWLHLATGKRLFAGEYFPGGSDPFSYSAEGRAWVNHSWLADPVMYLLYGGDGVVLVAAKALLAALTFGLLIAIRRPQFALWPWAAVACVGVLATAPQFTLRPFVASMLFFAVTLFLLFRVPHKKDPKQFLIAIGVTFWLWASCDQWFFVGPLALALLLIGDLIQKYGFNSPDEPEGTTDADTLGRLPDTAALAKALGVGLLACTLTPNHVRVWELPFELVGAPGTSADPWIRLLLLSPTDSEFVNKPMRGANVNGLAYALLLVVGAVVVGLAGSMGVGRVRVSHTLLWLGFAIMSLLSIYAIPFFVLVAVPLVAAQLNAFSSRAELKTWGDPRTRLLLIGSSLGRVLSVLGVCALCVLAYPGWVHPDTNTPAAARRVAWVVEPDPALVQAAEQLKTWRAADALPADNRGVITHTDLANYVAWFAPQEKVFVNGRFNHHRPELPAYVTLRKGLGLFGARDEPPNPKDATDVLARLSADYVVLTSAPAEAAQRLYQQWGEWSVWYTDGRTTMFGWRPEPTGGKASFAALRLDPAWRAFGPGVKKAPDPPVQQPLAQGAGLGWEEAFVRAPRPTPSGATEALGWVEYKDALIRRQYLRQSMAGIVLLDGLTTQNSLHHVALRYADLRGALRVVPRHAESESDDAAMRAIPLLAVRAARRAIAEDPDHPDGYYALARAMFDTDLPFTESERALAMVVAYRQCLDRLPKPDRYKRGQFAAVATNVARELAQTYLGRPLPWRDQRGKDMVEYSGFPIDVIPLRNMLGQPLFQDRTGAVARGAPNAPNMTPVLNGTPFVLAVDAAREALQLALDYAPIDFAELGSDEAKGLIKQLEGAKNGVENAVIRSKERYNAGRGMGPKLPALVMGAVRSGLLGEALALLSNKDMDLSKEFGKEALDFATLRVALELVVGRVENASETLKDLSDPNVASALEQSRAAGFVQMLKYQKAILTGEYKAAGDTWESIVAGIGQFDNFPPPGPAVPQQYVLRAVQGANPTKDPTKVLPAMLAPPLAVLPGHAQTLQLYFWLDTWDTLVVMIQRGIFEGLGSEATFFYRRGVLLLLEGDIPAAKERFKESLRKAPRGWEIQMGRPAVAEQYLQLIERAEKKAAKP